MRLSHLYLVCCLVSLSFLAGPIVDAADNAPAKKKKSEVDIHHLKSRDAILETIDEMDPSKLSKAGGSSESARKALSEALAQRSKPSKIIAYFKRREVNGEFYTVWYFSRQWIASQEPGKPGRKVWL